MWYYLRYRKHFVLAEICLYRKRLGGFSAVRHKYSEENSMRAFSLIALLAVTGCSQTVTQELTESASRVLYSVSEGEIVEPRQRSKLAVDVSPRPKLRPLNLFDTKPSLGETIAGLFQPAQPKAVDIAYERLGQHERTNRSELREFLGVDPVRVEWCAAFVNASLHAAGQPGSETVSANPLMARSFLDWGEPVPFKDDPDSPRIGDIAIFPRGRYSWQGHVGFYMGTSTINGVAYWKILSGNQSNQVTVSYYPASRAIGLRRLAKYTVTDTWFQRIRVSTG